MNDIFEDLTDEEIDKMMDRHCWPLHEIIIFFFGLKAIAGKEDYINHIENGFPIRQYTEALQATNQDKNKLVYVKKEPSEIWFDNVIVRKSNFFEWAIKNWEHYPEAKKVTSKWKKYKYNNEKPLIIKSSKVCAKEMVPPISDGLQKRDFLEHCKENPPESYKANLRQMAIEIHKAHPELKLKEDTIRKAIVKRTNKELHKMTSQ